MKPSEVIREARNLLFEKGWTQGIGRNDDGNLCSVGAVVSAVVGEDRAAANEIFLHGIETLIYEQATRYVGSAIGGMNVIPWNDDPRRAFDEVVEAFDKAEKLAEADGQ